jgi:tetratricopeptide (TPR) repeat protein
MASQRVSAELLLHNAARLALAERLAPASASIRLAKGSQYLLLGRTEPAIRAYLEALRLEPRPEIYLNLGRAQWQAGLQSAALGNFEIASRLDPSLYREIPRPAADALSRR